MSALVVRVVGDPAPQGSKRHVGNGRMIESSRKVGPWRVMVAWYAADAARDARWQRPDGPISVEVVFTLPRPKSAPKSRLWPDRRPDVDKLLRSTFDALTEAGVIRDDAQVVKVFASKLYALDGEPTGAHIRIEPVDA